VIIEVNEPTVIKKLLVKIMSIDSGTWRKIFICYTAPDFVDDNPLRQ